MEAKKQLGKDIVTFYHGETVAEESAAEWTKRFSNREDPTDIEGVTVPAAELTDGKIWICRLLVLLGLFESNGKARQKVVEGAVTIGPERRRSRIPRRMSPSPMA